MCNKLLERYILVVYIVDWVPSIDREQESEEVGSYYIGIETASDGIGMGMPDYSPFHLRMICRFR